MMRFHRADLWMQTPRAQQALRDKEIQVTWTGGKPAEETGPAAQVRSGLSYIAGTYGPQPLRWMVWPRHFGKTHRLLSWWLEGPERRVIITLDEHAAGEYRHRAEALLLTGEHRAGAVPVLTAARWKELEQRNIMGVTRWVNGHPNEAHAGKAVAFDELSVIIGKLARLPRDARAAWIASAGENEPYPRGLRMDPAYEKDLRKHGLTGNE